MDRPVLTVGGETFTLEALGAIRRVLDSEDFAQVLRYARGVREAALGDLADDLRMTPDALRLLQGRVNGIADLLGGLAVAANHYTAALAQASQPDQAKQE